MLKISRLFATLTAVTLIISNVDFAAASELEYPELVVTPRASERLQNEASKEKSTRWTTHATLAAPALMTLVASALQKESGGAQSNTSRTLGFTVGGGWIVASALLSALHAPYAKGWESTEPMQRKSERDQLLRERDAESTIQHAGSMGTKLSWISFVTNLAANGYMMSKADRKSSAFVIDGLGVLASFTPVIFKHKWTLVSREHASYKKKIYGPITSLDVAPALVAMGTPGLAMNLRF